MRLSRLLDRLRRSGRRRARSPSSAAPTTSTQLIADLHASGMRFVLDMVVNHAGDTRAAPAPAPRLVPRSGDLRSARPGAGLLSARPPPRLRAGARRCRDLSVGARGGTRSRATASTGSAWTPRSTCLPTYFHDSFFPAVRGARDRTCSRSPRSSSEGSTAYVRAVPRRRVRLGVSLSALRRAASMRSGTVARPIGSRRRSPTASRGVGADRALDLVLFVDNHDVPRFANLPGYGSRRGRDPPAPPARARSDLHAARDPAALLRRRARHVRRRRSRQPARPADVGERSGGARAAASRRGGRGLGDGLRARPEAVERCAAACPRSSTASIASCGVRTAPPIPNVLAFSRGSGADMRIVVVSNGAAQHRHDAHSGARHRRRHQARRRARRRCAGSTSRSRAASSSSICPRARPRSIESLLEPPKAS